jgi:hypothetical protein
MTWADDDCRSMLEWCGGVAGCAKVAIAGTGQRNGAKRQDNLAKLIANEAQQTGERVESVSGPATVAEESRIRSRTAASGT